MRSNRFYTILNIAGFALGLSCILLILFYISDELSYDRYHRNYRRIYRLESEITISGSTQQVAKSSFAIGPVMKKEFPEIEEFVRFKELEYTYFRYKDNVFLEDKVWFADSGIFKIFDHTFIRGNPRYALSEPNSLVISEAFANRYFNDEDPVGKRMDLGNGLSCVVTSVIKNMPENSHLRFDALISMNTYPYVIGPDVFRDLENRQFWAVRIFTYILLKEGTTIDAIDNKFPGFHDTYIADLSKRFNGTFRLLHTRLDRIHLHSKRGWDLPTGDIRNIYIFSSIALFILLIAGINYMNLSTARSSLKAREIGIKKVMGAGRSRLIGHFLINTLILSAISLIIAIFIAELFIPVFNQLTGKSLHISWADHYPIYMAMAGITLFMGIASGIYPAFILTSFKPTDVMKGEYHSGRKGAGFRKVLIILQFFITITIISATLIVARQLQFLKNQDLGYDKSNVLVVPVFDSTTRRMVPALKQELLTHPPVRYVSLSLGIPGHGSHMDIFLVEGPQGMKEQLVNLMIADYDYIDLMGMELVQGRKFDKSYGTDPQEAVIINQTAARMLGWENDPIGKEIHRRSFDPVQCKVIGVVKDFYFQSLHQEIGPMFIFLTEKANDFLNIRIAPEDPQAAIGMIRQGWELMNPNVPFIYYTLEEHLADQYVKEEKLRQFIGYFALLSVFISLLGLFGLSSFMIDRKTKNVGIRKVLGASAASLVYLLVREFLWLILIAWIVAVPVGWLLMDIWLQHFAYRIRIGWVWFALSGLIVLIMAMATVIFQTYKAANSNPVDVVKYE